MPVVLNARKVGHYLDDTYYIGRPSKFGNPFRTGPDGDRDEVIDKYEAYLLANPALIAAAKRELRGLDLICWCAPKRCHGDILLRIANEKT
jgi:hypothetical protein